jgi:hypothetical protein
MSEIKVNKISQRSGTAITLGNSGTDFQLPSGAELVAQSGSTITIASGATITNSGTASGFGPTGAVNWNTTKITANPNPAVSGVGYFCDTSSAAFTVTLPAAPSAGAIVALSDYTGTWATNNLTVGRNSSNINGAASDLILNQSNTTATLIYVDATEGWRVIDTGSLREIDGAKFVIATGGTITTSGDYKIHTFTGPGTFTVTCAGNSAGSSTVDYVVVAGGGASPVALAQPISPVTYVYSSGGGGAGGFREGYNPGSYTASPLATTSLPVTAQGYPITVGSGGTGGTGSVPAGAGGAGNPSVFSTITSTGGGRSGGGGFSPTSPIFFGQSGGSGGGGGAFPGGTTGGSGNTPPVAPPQGNNGGTGTDAGPTGSGGGGGASAVGGNGCGPAGLGGSGGNGVQTSINGSATYYAGGGGGSAGYYTGAGTGGVGGLGGGGNGGGTNGPSVQGQNGTVNTGGGAGGTQSNNQTTRNGNNGGSGIVIIRYKFQ